MLFRSLVLNLVKSILFFFRFSSHNSDTYNNWPCATWEKLLFFVYTIWRALVRTVLYLRASKPFWNSENIILFQKSWYKYGLLTYWIFYFSFFVAILIVQILSINSQIEKKIEILFVWWVNEKNSKFIANFLNSKILPSLCLTVIFNESYIRRIRVIHLFFDPLMTHNLKCFILDI